MSVTAEVARLRRAEERAQIARRAAFLADLARTVRSADRSGVMGEA